MTAYEAVHTEFVFTRAYIAHVETVLSLSLMIYINIGELLDLCH